MAAPPPRPEQTTVPRWKIIGPGLVVAATGVGAADLVATLIAGQKFGYTLLWCVVVGCVMKIVLVEGAGRYSLSTGQTIFEGWRSLGAWTTWYFAPYIVIWGFVYGAAAMAGTGLALQGLFGGLSTTWWGILSGLIGLVLVWTGRYRVFEKVLAGPRRHHVRDHGRRGPAHPAQPRASCSPASPRASPTTAWSTRSPSRAASAARSPSRRTATGCARRAGHARATCA